MKRIIFVLTAAALVSGCGIFGGGGDKKRTPVLGERLPILVYEANAEPDPELADVTIVLPAPRTNEEWTQPGGNASKNMGHLTVTQPLDRAWSASIGKGSTSRAQLVAGPVVGAGRVYTIDTRGEVRAFDARSGSVVWRSDLAKRGDSDATAFGGGVSYGNGRVFATTGWGKVVALDATTGNEVWRTSLNAPLRGAPAVDGDRVVVITQDNQIATLSATDGSTLWESAGTIETSSLLGAATPAIALDTVVAGYSSGELVAMRIENGRPV